MHIVLGCFVDVEAKEGLLDIIGWAEWKLKSGQSLLWCTIQLIEYPIPAAAASQKASHADISGTKRGIIDPLVSKLQEKNS